MLAQPFSRLAAPKTGVMDELAAAAAVVAMTIDDNAGSNVEQRGSCGTCGAADAAMADMDIVAVDKENINGHAAAGAVEDAASKVASAPRVLMRARQRPPLIR